MNQQQTQHEFDTVRGAVRRLAADQRGVVLVVAMWILVMVTVMGVMGTSLSRTELYIAGNTYQQNRAFYAADSGLNRTIATMNNTLFWAEDLTKTANNTTPVAAFVVPGTTTPDTSAAVFTTAYGAKYTVTVQKNTPVTGYYLVKSVGTVTSSPNTKVTVEAVLRTAPYASWTYATMGCGNYSLKSKGGTYVYGDMFGGSQQLDLGAPAQGATPAASAHIVGGDVFALSKVVLDAASDVLPYTDPLTGDTVGGNVYTEADAALASTANPAVQGNVMAKGTISGAAVVTGTQTAGISPGVPNLCLLATLRKTIITQEDINSYTGHADWFLGANTSLVINNTTAINAAGTAGLVDWNFKAVDPAKGAIVYVNGTFKVDASCAPCYYTGTGMVIADAGILINGGFKSFHGMDDAANEVDKLDRLSLVVRNNNNMDVNADLDVFGLIQLGSVGLFTTQIWGGKANINAGSMYVKGMIFVPGSVFLSNTGGTVIIKFHPIDTTVVRPRYEVGQWRRV